MELAVKAMFRAAPVSELVRCVILRRATGLRLTAIGAARCR